MEQPPTSDSGKPPSWNRIINAFSALVGVGVCLMMVLVSIGVLFRADDETAFIPTPGATVSPTEITFVASESPENLPSSLSNTPIPASALPIAATVTQMLIATTELSMTPETLATESPSATPTMETDELPPGENGDCAPPDGWQIHYVLPGETLFAYVLGSGGTISTDDLRRANCLTSDLLQVGQPLYLPPGAAENVPSSDPVGVPVAEQTGPRVPNCDPHCAISIRPGWRAEQIAAAIDQIPVGFWGTDFLAAIGPDAALPSHGFWTSRPSGRSLEGFFYPGTYELGNEDGAADFRDMLLAAFASVVSPDAEASAAAHGLTFYEALTLASIIQRESWAASEQALISSVFHNRLRTGSRLGATVTVQYVLGGPGNWWPRVSGGQVNTASPYNTYVNTGLPPGPISNPDIQAINAALSPPDTNFLYFTGNCRGSGNLYAATYDEHLANVNACR